jgi:methylmalonyl-CoA/ethylmalonyl-CoA epimerase
MSAVKLDHIGQIALTVKDLARARAFYRDVLGMTFLFDAGSMAFFQCGGVRLVIGIAEQETRVGGTILYYKVTRITEVCAALEGKGVHFLQAAHEVAKMPDHTLWMAFLNDSEDNVLGLMEEVRTS